MAPTPEQRFIQTWAIATLLCGLFLGALVVLVDPYGLFGTDLFTPVILTNRTQKIEAMRTMQPRPEAFIFGSSRVFRMDPDQLTALTGLTAYNASVSYARPEEHLALYRVITEDLGIRPKLIVVGLSVGEFNHDPIDPQTITHPLLRTKLPISRTTFLRTVAATLKERVNPGMVRDMVTSIFFRFSSPPSQVTFQENGMQISAEPNADRSERIRLSIPGTIRFFNTGADLSAERLAWFSDFVTRATAAGTRVHVLLLPVAEAAREPILEHTAYQTHLETLRTWMADLAAHAPGMTVTDGTTPSTYGADPNNFADATHPQEQVLQALLHFTLSDERENPAPTL